MSLSRGRIVQIVSVLLLQALAVMLLLWVLTERLAFVNALVIVIVLSLAQAIAWYVFINFLSWLPTLVYPIATFVVTGLLVALLLNVVFPTVDFSILDGIIMVVVFTLINAILGALFSLDEDSSFDRNVTQKIVRKRAKPIETTEPGILYLEIDGLGKARFERAVREGYMPTLKKWLDDGKYEITEWETDFTAQTGAMQAGILQGNNDGIPAYRWWDRKQKRIVMSGDPRDLIKLEARLSNQRGLLADGGASRGNMFSGDATESLFTFSTLLNRSRGMGPGFYLYFLSPYVVARVISRFVLEVLEEWADAAVQNIQHRRGKVKYVVSARNPGYAFLRGFMGPVLQDLTTYAVISDIARGVPAVYALYAGYDDLSHFAGMDSPEAFEMLKETDRYFARIERALLLAPRPYKIVILSDHGQTTGPTFKSAYGVSLEELVKALVKGKGDVFAELDTNEAWDNVNAFLSETLNSNTRTAGLVRTMLASKTSKDEIVAIGPQRDAKHTDPKDQAAQDKQVIVLGSGCTGLIYFRDANTRMTYEEIQEKYPELILGLLNHPGIGFVLVESAAQGVIAVRKDGVCYVRDGKVEGHNPLAQYGPNALAHVRREMSFEDSPDIVVNSILDPQTQEMPGFENQVSHHGGLGGPQNHPFIFHPRELPATPTPILTAVGAYGVLRQWRDTLQNITPPSA